MKNEAWRRSVAKDLWKKMLNDAFETGHPWITGSDPSNLRSPQDHVGAVHSSTLYGNYAEYVAGRDGGLQFGVAQL